MTGKPVEPAPGPERGSGDTPMTRTYLAVLAVEIVVVTALWFFQSHFSR